MNNGDFLDTAATILEIAVKQGSFGVELSKNGRSAIVSRETENVWKCIDSNGIGISQFTGNQEDTLKWAMNCVLGT